jgi:hypothetical protein
VLKKSAFMLNWLRFPTLTLSALLQFAPLVRVAVAESTVAVSPLVAVIRWLTGAAAVAGAFHSVSGATGLTITAGGAKVTTPISTNGIPIPGFRMSIISSFYGAAAAYRFSNLPPGLSGSLQGVITGTPTQTGQYTVLVTGYEHSNASGNSFQTSFPVSVVDQAPNVVTPPASQTVVAGSSVSFKVTATGTGLLYRWLKDDIELAAPAGTAAAYSIASAKTTDAGRYKVRISNTGGVVVSAEAILTVTQPGPTLVAGPLGSDVHEGEALILTVLATSTAPLTYQWLKDGTPIDGGTTTTMSIGSVKPTDTGSYSVLVSAGGSSIPAGPAVVKVNPPPALTLGPVAGDGSRTMTVSTIVGRSYVLEDRPTLDVGTWSPVTTVVATGPSTALSAPSSPAAAHFWRLRVVPLVQ